MNSVDPPRRRHHQLITQEVGSELLIYDPVSGQARCLNSAAALVWQACDGRHSIQQIAEQLEMSLEWVEAALEQLRDQDLLDQAATSPPAFTRRETLRSAALAIPAVLSLSLPLPAAAASCVGSGTAPPGTNLGGAGGSGFCSDGNADATCTNLRGNSCCSGRARARQCNDAAPGPNFGTYSVLCECV